MNLELNAKYKDTIKGFNAINNIENKYTIMMAILLIKYRIMLYYHLIESLCKNIRYINTLYHRESR
jgi:hypothetical protein